MYKKESDIVVVGAGLSGLMASINAKRISPDASVLLVDNVEKSDTNGRAISFSGHFLSNVIKKAGLPDDFEINKSIINKTGMLSRFWRDRFTVEVHDKPKELSDFFYTLDYSIFESALKKEAQNRGVGFLLGDSVSCVSSFGLNDRFDEHCINQHISYVDTKKGVRIFGDYFIDAAGRSRLFANKLGIKSSATGFSSYGRVEISLPITSRAIDWDEASSCGFYKKSRNIIFSGTGGLACLSPSFEDCGNLTLLVGYDGYKALVGKYGVKLVKSVYRLFPELKWVTPCSKLIQCSDDVRIVWHNFVEEPSQVSALYGGNFSLTGDAAITFDDMDGCSRAEALYSGACDGAIAGLYARRHPQREVARRDIAGYRRWRAEKFNDRIRIFYASSWPFQENPEEWVFAKNAGGVDSDAMLDHLANTIAPTEFFSSMDSIFIPSRTRKLIS